MYNNNKLAIFYHVCEWGDWREIVNEQVLKLQQSGLYDYADYIHVGFNGDHTLPYSFAKINCVKYNQNRLLESDTLLDLWRFCSANPDFKVMYMHVKGITWFNDDQGIRKNVQAWRRYLEYFTIEKWKKSVELLNDHDCVGTEWDLDAEFDTVTIDFPHYAGNFWWANASYIKKLDPNFLYNEYQRWAGEFWIGTKNPKFYSFYNSNQNKYLYNIPRAEYEHLA